MSGGGGIGGAIGSAVGSLGGVGKVVGPAIQLGSGANPLGVFGSAMASEAIGSALNGGGGGSANPTPGQNNMQTVYAQPGYNYGANTYTMGKNPIDASKYFITGDKGVYNLMPQLAPLYGDKTVGNMPGTNSYNVYQTIYDKMAGDTKAQEALAAAFGPKTYTPTYSPMSMIGPLGFGKQINALNAPKYVDRDILSALQEQRAAASKATFPRANPLQGVNSIADMINGFRNNAPQFQQAMQDRFANTYKPIQYVDWGFNSKANTAKTPWEALANYAGKQNNPFFVPFAPETNTTPPTPMRSGGLAGLLKD